MRTGCFDPRLCVTIATAMIGIGMTAIAPASAQTPGTAGPITFDLFDGNDVNVNPTPHNGSLTPRAGRRRRANARWDGSRSTCRQVIPCSSRRSVRPGGAPVLAFLNSQGINPSRFFADVAVGGTQNNVRLDLDVSQDTTAPSLDVTWTPPKGTKVRAGTRITARAIAKDDANLWQSGIKTIDLDVQGGGRIRVSGIIRSRGRPANALPPRRLWKASTLYQARRR